MKRAWLCQRPALRRWAAPVKYSCVTGTARATVKIANRPVSWDWPAASCPVLRPRDVLKSKPSWSAWPPARPTSDLVSPRRRRPRPLSVCRRNPTRCLWPTTVRHRLRRREPWPALCSVTRYIFVSALFHSAAQNGQAPGSVPSNKTLTNNRRLFV